MIVRGVPTLALPSVEYRQFEGRVTSWASDQAAFGKRDDFVTGHH